MLLGQTEDLKKEATLNQFSDQLELKVGVNRHRVLRGPFLVRSVYWPTMVEEEGETRQKTKAVVVPTKTGSPFLKALADSEKEFRRMQGEADPRSNFSPSSKYLYLAFDKDDPEHNEKPEVKVASYKYTIYTRLEEIQSEESTKNAGHLKNGLIFMYDVLIKKTVGDPNKPMFTTRYTVDVDTENNVAQGKIPMDLLKMSAEELNKTLIDNKIYEQIFTPAEMEAIEKCNIDIPGMYTPQSDEEIIAKLMDSPIAIRAKNFSTGNFLFPQNDQFINFIQTKGLRILEDGETKEEAPGTNASRGDAPGAKEEAPPQENKVEIKTDKATEEAPAAVKTEEGSTINKWNLSK